MSRLILIVIFFCFSLPLLSQTGTIEIRIDGIRKVEGSILASLYNSPEGFPEKADNSMASEISKLTGKSQTLYFHNVPHGRYALAIVHDQNDNGVFDKNFLGIPREGYAVSNNIKGFSAPGFNESSFELNSDVKVLELTVIYF